MLVGIWTAGWARSRGLAPPRPRCGAFHVEVGLPDQKARYVFPALDAETLRALADRIEEPAVFLKVCAPPEQVSPLLSERWQMGPPRHFMAISATAMETQASVPAGYRLVLERADWSLLATIADAQGAPAAQGRLVLEQGWAIFDRIETGEAHRRRGLGSAVMRALQSEAVKAGASGGLLVATGEGRQLYARLGWPVLSDYSSAAIPLPSGSR